MSSIFPVKRNKYYWWKGEVYLRFYLHISCKMWGALNRRIISWWNMVSWLLEFSQESTLPVSSTLPVGIFFVRHSSKPVRCNLLRPSFKQGTSRPLCSKKEKEKTCLKVHKLMNLKWHSCAILFWKMRKYK